MDPITFLESQHREVESLFAQIEGLGEGKGREKKALFAELATKIEMHAKLEEKLFYPEGEEVDEDMTLEAYEEHDLVRGLLRKMKKIKASDETFMAKVSVLKELIEHHVKEEEGEYFPQCRKELGSERLAEIGIELQEMSEKLEAKSAPRKSTAKKAA